MTKSQRIQKLWQTSYLNSGYVYAAVTLFLLLVVALQQDSILRDFVLLFGIIGLGALMLLRDFSLRQIIYGWMVGQEEPVQSVPCQGGPGGTARQSECPADD